MDLYLNLAEIIWKCWKHLAKIKIVQLNSNSAVSYSFWM